MYSVLPDGWLAGVRQVRSPNFDLRPPECSIDLLVVHCISLPAGVFGTPHVEALFTNRLDLGADPSFSDLEGLKVSAHAVISRTGELTQYVSFSDRAWHAGVSQFEGRDRCNDFSVGIELEGTDDTPFTSIQYDQLASVFIGLLDHFPNLSLDRAVGHSDIAPGRKTDPGEHFDWERFRESVTAGLAARNARD